MKLIKPFYSREHILEEGGVSTNTHVQSVCGQGSICANSIVVLLYFFMKAFSYLLESVFDSVNADKDKQEAKEAAAYTKKGAR